MIDLIPKYVAKALDVLLRPGYTHGLDGQKNGQEKPTSLVGGANCV